MSSKGIKHFWSFLRSVFLPCNVVSNNCQLLQKFGVCTRSDLQTDCVPLRDDRRKRSADRNMSLVRSFHGHWFSLGPKTTGVFYQIQSSFITDYLPIQYSIIIIEPCIIKNLNKIHQIMPKNWQFCANLCDTINISNPPNIAQILEFLCKSMGYNKFPKSTKYCPNTGIFVQNYGIQ